MTPEESLLHQRKRAYQLACSHPEIQGMLGDLADFCHHITAGGVPETGAPVDVNRTMIMIGRQQVFDRIQRHLNLTIPQLYQIYTGAALVNPSGDNDA